MPSTPDVAVTPISPPPLPLAARLGVLAGDIKLSHTIFALPFAVLAAVLSARVHGGGHWGQFALILACMVTARTFAMAANRWLDADLDRANPRTAGRAIPSGRLRAGFVLATMAGCAGGFVLSTAGFGWLDDNWLPLWLSVPVLAYLFCYPLLKRFTWLCHLYLGAALGLAPVCAWIALAGRVDAFPLWLGGGVALWTAGFDILYACQDIASDRETGVYSVPAAVGVAAALWIARGLHVLTVGCYLLALRSASPPLGGLFAAAVGAAALLLVIEHALVRPDDLSKLGLAFFTVNGIVSLLLGTVGVLDAVW